MVMRISEFLGALGVMLLFITVAWAGEFVIGEEPVPNWFWNLAMAAFVAIAVSAIMLWSPKVNRWKERRLLIKVYRTRMAGMPNPEPGPWPSEKILSSDEARISGRARKSRKVRGPSKRLHLSTDEQTTLTRDQITTIQRTDGTIN